jgi:hypothetical protein
MVVIATPNMPPQAPCCDTATSPAPTTPAAVPFNGQSVISAPVSTVNGRPILSRMRAVSLTQGQTTTLEWQLHDKDGNPIDLRPLGFTNNSTYANPFQVVLRIKEQVALGVGNYGPLQVPATVKTAATGVVTVALTSNLTALPGVYYGEMALIDTSNPDVSTKMIFSNTFSVIISRGTFGSSVPGGPPPMAEIRLHLRDSSPSESFLLDHLMFDDAEIALAIMRPIQYWNEIPPPIATFTTQDFPFRYHWLEGICANLFFMVAEQFRRNQLSYSAAGVTLDDQNKEPNYERAGQIRWQAYREWVRAQKASINLEGAYGEIGSLYQYGAYSSGIRSRY